MGTNYYMLSDEDACPTCGRSDTEDLHIGKSSGGWCFGLHVIPEEGLNSLEDWIERLKGKIIKNEYGQVISLEELMGITTERARLLKWHEKPFNYASWEEFHKRNYSEEGPNGLLRHKISNHCIGHGEGTWDLIPGEFC